MLKLIIAIMILLPVSAFAKIENSALDPAHQAVIEAAIEKSCGLSGRMLQVQHTARQIRVNSGILDYTYTTVLVVRVGLNQYNFDEHHVTVESVFADLFDHTLRQWGTYSVQSVTSQSRRCL